MKPTPNDHNTHQHATLLKALVHTTSLVEKVDAEEAQAAVRVHKRKGPHRRKAASAVGKPGGVHARVAHVVALARLGFLLRSVSRIPNPLPHCTLAINLQVL